MGKARTRPLVLLTSLLACCPCAFALDPSLDVSQYAHTAWLSREGFPKRVIGAIAQTPDGYLYLGTEFGLLRFDGVRAVPWQPPAGQHLPGSEIRSLLVARDDALWIGTERGLASWRDGKLTQYPGLAGKWITALLEDRYGTVWAGAWLPSASRLCAIRAGSVQCYGEDGSFDNIVLSLFEDRRGNLWVGTLTGLWRWRPDPRKFYPMPATPNGIRGVAEDDKGALLVATGNGMMRIVDGKVEAYPLPGIEPPFEPSRLLRDRDGGLWIGTNDRGLLHLHQGRIDAFTRPDGLSNDNIGALFEDREGDIWATSLGGLDRFHNFAVPTISMTQGLSSDTAAAVLAAKDGSIWIGTSDGLNRWNNGQITIYRKQRVKSAGGAEQKRQRSQSGTANARVLEITDSGLPNDGVESIFEDDRGRIWVSTRTGLAYFENGRFVPVDGLPATQTNSIVEDGAGDIWISARARERGLFHLSHGNVVEQIPWARLGRKDFGLVLTADPLQSGLWIGFWDGGLAQFKDGRILASYTTADGLGQGRVNDLQSDPDGTLWAATEGGLSRVENGRIATLSSRNGLPCDAVHWTMEDDAHSVWLKMACGLARIAKTDLDAWSADPKRTIQVTVFDDSDGVRSHTNAGGYHPLVAKGADGKLWFSPFDGVSVIDPRHLAFNKLAPPVQIEQITADRKTYDAQSGLRLPPRLRDLEIDYTALSLVAPEKVRFRYKLEGMDSDWQDVGNRRQAFYTNLPPRSYRFRVIASNNSGVWNDTGAVLDFTIAPAYYQTNWFRALCVAAFLALLWVLYRFRIRQLRQQERKLRDVVETIPAIAWTALPDGWVDFSNHHWEEYTGLSLEKGAGSGWEVAVHPDDVKRHAEKWRASVANGEPFENEARYRRADGEYRWFLVRAVPLRDGGGKIRKWYGTKTDIEDRKNAERLQADLTHASRVSTMGELVASISHELAQPLTVTTANAKASLRWLQRDPPDLTEVRKGTERIVEAGTLASEIINRLRSLYKKSPPKRQLIAINEVIGEMTGMLRSEATRHGVSIRTDLKDDLPMTVADRVQLQQVLMNLMLNGIEAMKDTGGVLTVKSQLGEDGQIQISITDTGPGLPLDKVDQVFDAFFTTKPQGSGMGLAISKSIVESHGGRIWANGDDGRGATFYFTLRTAAEEVKAPLAVT